MELFLKKKSMGRQQNQIYGAVIIFLQGTKVFSRCKMHILKSDDTILKETSMGIVVLSSF